MPPVASSPRAACPSPRSRSCSASLTSAASGACTRVAPGDESNVPEGCWVLIELRDGGVGMDSETLARAFEPFFTTKPAGRGTGLGLASVKRAIRAASGEIRIHSLVGRGTVVEVWLPASTPR